MKLPCAALLAPMFLPALLVAAASALAAEGCPEPASLRAADLVGTWEADLGNRWDRAQVELVPHPTFPGSLSGTLRRAGTVSRVAADLDEGEFAMEESADGARIGATWFGAPVAGQCGREIRGRWQAGEDGQPRGFVMKRVDAAAR